MLSKTADLRLAPWDESGLALLRDMNTEDQKRHLGGPETEQKLLDRHARYLTYSRPGEVRMLRIELDGGTIGSVGYWELEWQGERAYEMGWELLMPYHGRGIGSVATGLLIAELRDVARHRYVYAFPTPDNPGSNGICRKLGFELIGISDVEYPLGTISPHNNWRLDLYGNPANPRPVVKP